MNKKIYYTSFILNLRSQNAPTRSRPRRRTKKIQDSRTELHEQKPQFVSSVSEEATVRMKAEAEAFRLLI